MLSALVVPDVQVAYFFAVYNNSYINIAHSFSYGKDFLFYHRVVS